MSKRTWISRCSSMIRNTQAVMIATTNRRYSVRMEDLRLTESAGIKENKCSRATKFEQIKVYLTCRKTGMTMILVQYAKSFIQTQFALLKPTAMLRLTTLWNSRVNQGL